MLQKPERILVFSSESDDSIDLQIYRLLYSDTNYDIFFVDGEYPSTSAMNDYILPSENGDHENVSANELIEFFDQIDDIEVINYGEIGLFYDYDLGFEFSESMIQEIANGIDPVELAPEIRSELANFSYVSQDWSLINWEDSKERLIENLDTVIKSEDDLSKINAVIEESAEYHDLVYPELFETMLYAADLYDTKHLFARTTNKIFCLKTTSSGAFPNLIYDRADIEQELEEIQNDEVTIIDIDPDVLTSWYEYYSLEDVDQDLGAN